MTVKQLRLAVTADDYEAAVRFYRDVLGLTELATWVSPDGDKVTALEAGRATMEIIEPRYADYIDSAEVGRRVAGHIRVAFEVDDTAAATDAATSAGATLIAPPTPTPWNSLNSRLDGPAGLQLTLFSEDLSADD